MKLFVAMPFSEEFAPVYDAIREASGNLGIQPIRVDELHEPGPIITQIVKEIGNSDFVVAEVSSRNANVYYEVGLAHCVRKPTMLIASKDAIANLPFDIRHNRVVVYDSENLASLRDALCAHLSYFVKHFGQSPSVPDLGTYFAVLADNKRDSKLVIQDYVNEVAKEFQLTDPQLLETKALPPAEGLLDSGS